MFRKSLITLAAAAAVAAPAVALSATAPAAAGTHVTSTARACSRNIKVTHGIAYVDAALNQVCGYRARSWGDWVGFYAYGAWEPTGLHSLVDEPTGPCCVQAPDAGGYQIENSAHQITVTKTTFG
jgi:hypothetical protein